MEWHIMVSGRVAVIGGILCALAVVGIVMLAAVQLIVNGIDGTLEAG